MWNVFRKKPQNHVRDLLFGDVPIKEWQHQNIDSQEIPWILFKQASDAIELNNPEKATDILKETLIIDELESRHYLQAWHALKQLGYYPEESIAKTVYGVIVEVGLDGGQDILAAYDDYTARYFNYSGASIIWDRCDNTLDKSIHELIDISNSVVHNIGVWEGKRPSPPKKGHVRLNFLTASGLHFGQGPIDAISEDPMGGSVFAVATSLMQQLIQKVSWLKKPYCLTYNEKSIRG